MDDMKIDPSLSGPKKQPPPRPSLAEEQRLAFEKDRKPGDRHPKAGLTSFFRN